MATKPVPVSKAKARRIWLNAQRLDQAAPFGAGASATPTAVAHLGYVQIDTINVVERCHHQILYTRIPDYRREHLAQAQSVDKTMFEYWTHALAYVPTADFRYFTRAMKSEDGGRSLTFSLVKPRDLRKVLGRIPRRLPLFPTPHKKGGGRPHPPLLAGEPAPPAQVPRPHPPQRPAHHP